jgi:Fic family protein
MLQRKAGPEPYQAFIPNALPPAPGLELSADLLDLAEQANRALGRLDGVARLIPDPGLFLYMYVRKEAVLSSQIEGTQSSFSELLLFESETNPGVPLGDVVEVSRYVAAMTHGLERLRGGFPLSSRLLREIHATLMASGRGSDKTPGEFRRSQNWIGGTRPGNAIYVPPPEDQVARCMSDLEMFLHDAGGRTPTLIKAALAHVQFETVHPFLDGNGRLGRLLITFLLCAENALSEPLLYLSLYLKQNRSAYYDLLQRVRVDGDWEAWLRFFLEGVVTTADQASNTARQILRLLDDDRTRIIAAGRAAGSALRLHDLLHRRVYLTIASATRQLRLSRPTVTAAIKVLQHLGIVRETTGRGRRRIYAYSAYLQILDEGTEPIRS